MTLRSIRTNRVCGDQKVRKKLFDPNSYFITVNPSFSSNSGGFKVVCLFFKPSPGAGAGHQFKYWVALFIYIY